MTSGAAAYLHRLFPTREATPITLLTRARPALVSAPVAQAALLHRGGNDSSGSILKRLKDDAWAEIGKVRQKLPSLEKRSR
jgi:hypothetical protein